MHFKTYSGAAKRAAFENADAKHWGRPHVYRVVSNTNGHQVAQGYVWRIKKETRERTIARPRVAPASA